jgi:hypothetical protein
MSFDKIKLFNELELCHLFIPVVKRKQRKQNVTNFNQATNITCKIDKVIRLIAEFLDIMIQEEVSTIDQLSLFFLKCFPAIS